MNCDRIAGWYQWLEYLTFGRALQRRRLEYLREVAKAKRVLILGDGDGRFTAAFLEENRAAVVDSIDISGGMVRLTERRIQRLDGAKRRLRVFTADARIVELPGMYDLVVTHYFLDCLTTEEVHGLVSRVSDVVSPGADWLISEFCIPERIGVRRLAAKVVIKALYLAFRMLTGLKAKRLPDYAGALRANGFRLARSRSGLGGVLVSELWQQFTAIEDLGGQLLSSIGSSTESSVP